MSSLHEVIMRRGRTLPEEWRFITAEPRNGQMYYVFQHVTCRGTNRALAELAKLERKLGITTPAAFDYS